MRLLKKCLFLTSPGKIANSKWTLTLGLSAFFVNVTNWNLFSRMGQPLQFMGPLVTEHIEFIKKLAPAVSERKTVKQLQQARQHLAQGQKQLMAAGLPVHGTVRPRVLTTQATKVSSIWSITSSTNTTGSAHFAQDFFPPHGWQQVKLLWRMLPMQKHRRNLRDNRNRPSQCHRRSFLWKIGCKLRNLYSVRISVARSPPSTNGW